MGGLARRATVLEQERAKGEPVFVVEAGDTAWKGVSLAENRKPQQRRKGELQAESFAASGIDAMVPGEGDLALGLDWVSATAEKYALPWLAANLECGGEKPFPATKRVERGGIVVGFLGVVGTGLQFDDCTVSEPVAAAREAATALGGVDALVILSHGDDTADAALAEAVPAADLVVNGHARMMLSTPRALPGAAFMLSGGHRGKHVGVARVTLVPGASGLSMEAAAAEAEQRLTRYRERLAAAKERLAALPAGAADPPKAEAPTGPPDPRRKALQAVDERVRLERQVEHYGSEIARLESEVAQSKTTGGPTHRLENRLVGLGTDIADHKATLAMVERCKAELGEAPAKQETSLPADTPFAGAAACAGCHAAQHAQWSGTAHARAWTTLVDAKRSADLDCWSCHATGAGEPGGPAGPASVGPLSGVQCESCHGPSKAHATSSATARPFRTPPVATCTQCHDGERDEGRFVEAEYMAKVRH